MPPSPPELPITIYTPDSGLRHPAEMLTGVWRGLFGRQSRGLAKRLLIRDLSAQYRESFLSFFWVLVPPLVTSAVWIFLNGQKILTVAETDLPYPVFVLTGTLLWTVFTGALNAPKNAILKERSLLTRVNFPREALLMVGLGDLLFNTIIQFIVLIPLFVVYKVHLSPLMLLAPLGILATALIGYAVGLLLTPASLLVSDIGRVIPIVARFGYFITPIIYPMPQSGPAAVLARLNPVTPLIVTTREWLTGQPATMLGPFLIVTGIMAAILLVSLVIFHLVMPIVIERMSA